MTAFRAMKLLEQRGLVAAEAHHGYRVTQKASDPAKGCPLAFVTGDDPEDQRSWTPVHRALLAAFQGVADRQGWSTLGLTCSGKKPKAIVDQVQAARVAGVALDAYDEAVIEALKRARIPVILVDAWRDDAGVDGAVQDNYRGGFLAGQYLAERGCKRVGWLGTIHEGVHSHERYGGAVGALRLAGLSMTPAFVADVMDPREGLAAARRLFAGPERPDGVIALWMEFALNVKKAADERGLVVGRDFELVGWSLEENYELLYRPAFAGGPVPPAVTWSARTMAEIALKRLAERRRDPDMPVVRLNVPTRLRLADGNAGAS